VTFTAFRISQTDGKISGAIADATLDELTPGDIVIKAAFSSVQRQGRARGHGRGEDPHADK
jgi:hypothetical protein